MGWSVEFVSFFRWGPELPTAGEALGVVWEREESEDVRGLQLEPVNRVNDQEIISTSSRS